MPVAVPDFAALVTIYSCHFLDKALHVENIGAVPPSPVARLQQPSYPPIHTSHSMHAYMPT